MMLGLKSKAFLERVYSARGEGKFLKDMPNVSKDQQVDLYGIFRMITKNDGDLAHHDYMNVFFNICDDIIELPDPDNSSSSSSSSSGSSSTKTVLQKMFSDDQSFDFPIFVKKICGKDKKNQFYDESLEKEILSNLKEIYSRMYSRMFTGKFKLLSCFKNVLMTQTRMKEDRRIFDATPSEPGLSYVIASIMEG
jgi:hypothetical protein